MKKALSAVFCLLFLFSVVAVPKISTAEETLVWVATSGKGKKYHYENCHTLKKGKSSLTISKAKAQGYTACGVCHPPE